MRDIAKPIPDSFSSPFLISGATDGCVDDNIVVADDRCNSLNLLWSF
jgi:hypothetical protein